MSKNEVKVNTGVSSTPSTSGNNNGWNGNDWYMFFLALPPVIYASGWFLDKIGFNVKDILEMDGRIHFKKGDIEFDIDRQKKDEKEIVDTSAEVITESDN